MINFKGLFGVVVMGSFIIQAWSADSIQSSDQLNTHIKDIQHTKIYEGTIQQIKDLYPLIIDVIHDLLVHTDYWKIQQLTPFSYFLSKDPTKWIYRKQEWARVDSNIAFLMREQEFNAQYLGLFHDIIKNYEQCSLYSDDRFVSILETLETFLSHYAYQDNPTTLDYKHNETFQQRFDRNAYLIRYYKYNTQRTVASCCIPNHFQRNWLSYFVGTTALLAFSYFIYTNKSKLQTWYCTAMDACQKFWQEHISSPIVNSLKILLREDREPFMTPEGVAASGVALDKQIRSYCAAYKPELDENAIENIVQEAKTGNMSFLANEWNKLVQKLFDPDTNVESLNISNKIRYSINFLERMLKKESKDSTDISTFDETMLFLRKLPATRQIVRLFDIRLYAKEVMINKVMLEVENQINANRLNFELTAVLPSALATYFVYMVSKTLFTSIVLQKNTYQPLRKALRNLHVIFNKYQQNCELTSTDQGFSYYWIEQFKKYSSQINLNERKMILEDLAELESYTYSPCQKLAVINRMYYNYHFLLPQEQ